MPQRCHLDTNPRWNDQQWTFRMVRYVGNPVLACYSARFSGSLIQLRSDLCQITGRELFRGRKDMRCKPIRASRGTIPALDGEQGSPSAHLNYLMTTDNPVTDGSASPDLLPNFT